MKKTLAVVFSGAIAVGALAGCASNDSSPSSSQSSPVAGAYTADRDVTAEDRQVFDTAMKGVEGAKTYELLKVATQVVSGVNYRFTVNVDDNGTKSQAKIIIYKPLDGDPTFVNEEK